MGTYENLKIDENFRNGIKMTYIRIDKGLDEPNTEWGMKWAGIPDRLPNRFRSDPTGLTRKYRGFMGYSNEIVRPVTLDWNRRNRRYRDWSVLKDPKSKTTDDWLASNANEYAVGLYEPYQIDLVCGDPKERELVEKWNGKLPPPPENTQNWQNDQEMETSESIERVDEEVFNEVRLDSGYTNLTLEEFQKISVAVSEPKRSQGSHGYLIYTIVSRYEDTNEYRSKRSYREILDLYGYLDSAYLEHGVIVPPPPTKESVAFIEPVDKEKIRKFSASQGKNVTILLNFTSIILFLDIEQRCVALDRYVKRLAAHPVINRDKLFNEFLQNKAVNYQIANPTSKNGFFKGMINNLKLRISSGSSDDFFKVKQSEMNALMKQSQSTLKTVQDLAKMKGDLHGQIGNVNKVLKRNNSLSEKVDESIEAQKNMNDLCKGQEKAYCHMSQIIGDHINIITKAKQVLDKGQLMKIELKGQNDSEKYSAFVQQVKVELKHMDEYMKDDFENCCNLYGNAFEEKRGESLDLSQENPTFEMEIIEHDKSDLKENMDDIVENFDIENKDRLKTPELNGNENEPLGLFGEQNVENDNLGHFEKRQNTPEQDLNGNDSEENVQVEPEQMEMDVKENENLDFMRPENRLKTPNVEEKEMLGTFEENQKGFEEIIELSANPNLEGL